jgi:transcriptional regulator with XRE-family HTH domain
MAPRPIDPEARRIGRVLRAIREQQGLTQVQVAADLGKKEGAYAAYESGRSRFTLPELMAVARALKVTTPHLATRLGFCGEQSADIAHVLVERFGPQLGSALVRLDRILARIEQADASALTVTIGRHVEHYEVGLNG